MWAVISSKSKTINTIVHGPYPPDVPASMYGPTSSSEDNEWVEVLVVPKSDYDALKKDLKIVRDSHRRQGQLNDALKAKLEKAESVLKYYADRTNYTLDDDFAVSGEMRRRVNLYGDQEEFNEFSSAAGRRAREYFKEKE